MSEFMISFYIYETRTIGTPLRLCPNIWLSWQPSCSAIDPKPLPIELSNLRVNPPYALSILQLCKWEDKKAYDEDPPTYIHYRIEWRVTVNNRDVSKDTEKDVDLAAILGGKLEQALRRKTAHHRQMRPDDPVIVASRTDRTKRNLTN
ncbi:hypothetical protein N7526_010683 [Penicillium atrosanguineum]|nr:hypothetical protein N7526_010683 [Penicillium atrosanguineum]